VELEVFDDRVPLLHRAVRRLACGSAGEALRVIRVPEKAANLCFDGRGIFIAAATSIYRVDTSIPAAV
jgi:hypothetical protein